MTLSIPLLLLAGTTAGPATNQPVETRNNLTAFGARNEATPIDHDETLYLTPQLRKHLHAEPPPRTIKVEALL